MIKTKEKSTALFIGIRWDQDCEIVPEVWKLRILGPGLDEIHLVEKPQDQGPMPQIKIPYCTFVQSKDTQVKIDSAWVDGSRRYSIHL